MPDAPPVADAILSARLDLLQQVLDEVEEIRKEMKRQKATLDAIDEFLNNGGALHKTRGDAMLGVRRAADALDLALETDENERVTEALSQLRTVEPLLTGNLDRLRKDAYGQFVELKRWSVAALDDVRLGKALLVYEELLTKLRRSTTPWAEYEAQIRRRGEALFSAYLDMLGSIAIRGIQIGEDLADESSQLINLLNPTGRNLGDGIRALNLLTRSEHIQLGYRGWNIWALPLLGQEVGLHLIRNGYLDYRGEETYHVVCADAYALHVLGPSYAAAAIFLELDPGSASGEGRPSDQIRAELLLEQLARRAPAERAEAVSAYADELRAAWDEATAAVGSTKPDVSAELREVTDTFLDRVTADYLGIDYDMDNLGDRQVDADRLTQGHSLEKAGHTRDLLVSMWWARVHNPEAHGKIYAGAQEALQATTISSGAPPPGSSGGGRTPGD